MKDVFRVRVGKSTDKRNGRTIYRYSNDRTSDKTTHEYMETRKNIEFLFRNNLTDKDKSLVFKKWRHKNLTVGVIDLTGKNKLQNHFLYV